MTTLREALTQAKPSVGCSVSGRNTKSTNWPGFREKGQLINDIRLWDAFNIDNLNESYGHILDAPIPQGELNVPDPRTSVTVVEIRRTEHVNELIKWNDDILGPTIEYGRHSLQLEIGVGLNRTYRASNLNAGGEIGRKLSRSNKHGTGKVKVDHVIELDGFPLPTLVLGLGRPSHFFTGRPLSNGRKQREENLWPLRQLANLCFLENTRFGYILTDVDLLACCFSAQDPTTSILKWSAQIMPIPWSKSGRAQLTTDLALWWLCMLALSGPHNRMVTPPWEMTSIDAWGLPRRLNDEQGWTEQHMYSRFERQTNNPFPQAHQAPVQEAVQDGQPAAVQAASGSYGDDDFEPGMAVLLGTPIDGNAWLQEEQ